MIKSRDFFAVLRGVRWDAHLWSRVLKMRELPEDDTGSREIDLLVKHYAMLLRLARSFLSLIGLK